MTRLLSPALLVLAILTACPSSASAQFPWPVHGMAVPRPSRQGSIADLRATSLDDVPRHVVSTNPGALMFWSPSVEYELRTLPFLAVGAGASISRWTIGHTATNREVLARLYPAGVAFNGPSIGLRVGSTQLSKLGRSRTWTFEGGYTVTPSKHAYMSFTGGLRHLSDGPRSLFGEFQPIFRMNVGIGF